MRAAWLDFRMAVAETLLGWALAVAPREHEDTPRLAATLYVYFDGLNP